MKAQKAGLSSDGLKEHWLECLQSAASKMSSYFKYLEDVRKFSFGDKIGF